jgi:hypothetical protein
MIEEKKTEVKEITAEELRSMLESSTKAALEAIIPGLKTEIANELKASLPEAKTEETKRNKNRKSRSICQRFNQWQY